MAARRTVTNFQRNRHPSSIARSPPPARTSRRSPSTAIDRQRRIRPGRGREKDAQGNLTVTISDLNRTDRSGIAASAYQRERSVEDDESMPTAMASSSSPNRLDDPTSTATEPKSPDRTPTVLRRHGHANQRRPPDEPGRQEQRRRGRSDPIASIVVATGGSRSRPSRT